MTLVDGRQHDFWRVDETRLRAALRLTGLTALDAPRCGWDISHVLGRGVRSVCSPVHKLLQ